MCMKLKLNFLDGVVGQCVKFAVWQVLLISKQFYGFDGHSMKCTLNTQNFADEISFGVYTLSRLERKKIIEKEMQVQHGAEK